MSYTRASATTHLATEFAALAAETGQLLTDSCERIRAGHRPGVAHAGHG